MHGLILVETQAVACCFNFEDPQQKLSSRRGAANQDRVVRELHVQRGERRSPQEGATLLH
eukprot:15480058-Alexandrium_andersonii.AAC.1